MDNTKARVAETLAAYRDAMPSKDDVSAAAKHNYDAARAKAQASLTSIRLETEAALKAAGLKDKTTAEKLHDQLAESWRALRVGAGIEEPNLADRARAALHGEAASSGIIDKTLKFLHLRDKSALEKTHDSFASALHKIRVELKQEEPSAQEKVCL